MKLEYENGTLRVENAEGLRWQLADAQKPALGFDYDALSVIGERALRRVGPTVHPLAEGEVAEVRALVERLRPPPWATFQKQTVADLRALARGLIGSLVAQLEYDGLLDVMITGRPGSSDLYAEEARRVLSYADSVWNAFHGLAAQIERTPREELRSVKEYAEMMPFPPPMEYFSAGVVEELLHGARGKP
ncbi:MAG TPA: hypothetical protein VLI67_06245 [Vicinamibacteria bacterium]|nr:hypothetical protein [Vicinamibacteria bacterium]